jgi:hypothetical protein
MIQSSTTRQFWDLFANMPPEVQVHARRAFRTFQSNSFHPGLQFKKLGGEDAIYSARIGLGYRAVGAMTRSGVVWFWIGNHADFDRMFQS